MRSGRGVPRGTSRAFASPFVPASVRSRIRIHRQLACTRRDWTWIAIKSCLGTFIDSEQVTILGIAFMAHQVWRRRRVKKLGSLSAAQFLDWLRGWIRFSFMLSFTDLL